MSINDIPSIWFRIHFSIFLPLFSVLAIENQPTEASKWQGVPFQNHLMTKLQYHGFFHFLLSAYVTPVGFTFTKPERDSAKTLTEKRFILSGCGGGSEQGKKNNIILSIPILVAIFQTKLPFTYVINFSRRMENRNRRIHIKQPQPHTHTNTQMIDNVFGMSSTDLRSGSVAKVRFDSVSAHIFHLHLQRARRGATIYGFPHDFSWNQYSGIQFIDSTNHLRNRRFTNHPNGWWINI